jgi:hypothetical protein
MSKKKLVAIIIACTLGGIISLIILHPWQPQGTYSLRVHVTPSRAGSVILLPSARTYKPSEQVRLTAFPASGYRFASWTGDVSSANHTITITMGDSDKDVTATFEGYEPMSCRISDILISSGSYRTLPTNGICLQAYQRVTVDWSASGHLSLYLFTQSQFDYFKTYSAPLRYEERISGEGGHFSGPVTNNDTYYVVITNRLGPSSQVMLHEATFTLD